jgi:adenylosuccinate lyase
MQRDLTDSTTQRNIGVAFAHALLAITNLIDGTKALEVNQAHLLTELDANPAVLGEAIQSVMRTAGISGVPNMQNPYERLKEFTRGKAVTLDELRQFIHEVGLAEAERNRLLALTPANYTGLAAQIAKEVLNS